MNKSSLAVFVLAVTLCLLHVLGAALGIAGLMCSREPKLPDFNELSLEFCFLLRINDGTPESNLCFYGVLTILETELLTSNLWFR